MPEDTKKREEYAPITQGLREYIERHPTMMYAVGLTDLCDNIDAVHKALETENAKLRKKQKEWSIGATMDHHAIPALRSAAWIAEQQWNGKLQFERKGETMVIAGTDGYVYAGIEADATFCGWDDGDVVAFKATKAFMRFCKLAYDWCWHKLNMSLTVEFSPVFSTVTITITNRDDAPDAMSMSLPTINERIHAEKFDDMPEGQNEGHIAITSSTWRKIDKLVNTLGLPYDAWVFHDRGPLHAFDLTCEERSARIIAMPTRGGE